VGAVAWDTSAVGSVFVDSSIDHVEEKITGPELTGTACGLAHHRAGSDFTVDVP
jgi:hypothetical protein